MSATLDALRSLWGPGEGAKPTFFPDRRRDDFADLVGALGFATGAEIGVGGGRYSRTLCSRNPSLRLLCVDNWSAYPAARSHRAMGQEEQESIFARAAGRLGAFPGATIVRGSSMEAARAVEDHSLDFVYIDANHTLPSVVSDVAAWEPKVRSGGIVAGHDFTHARFNGWHPLTREFIRPGPDYKPCHVIEAVCAWVACFEINPWFVFDGARGAASWFWVKA